MKISIIYHSETGRTKKMAGHIFEGLKSFNDIESRLMGIDDCDYEFIEDSKAVIFGSPNYYGTMSWQMKKFIDEIKHKAKLNGKIGAAFSSGNCIGGGGETVLMNIYQTLLIHGMLIYTGGVKEGKPLTHYGVTSNEPDSLETREKCIKLGKNIATKVIELF